MSKRLIQDEKLGEEECVVAKSKTNVCFFVSKTVDQSPIALGSSASHSPGTLTAQSSNMKLTSSGRPVARGLNENTASSCQVWHSDVNPNTSTGRPVVETTNKSHWYELISPQLEDIWEQCWPSWESLLHRTTNTWSSTRRRHARGRRQRDDLEFSFKSATMKAAVHLGQDYQERICVPRTPTSGRSNS